jgi:hypothetical protein
MVFVIARSPMWSATVSVIGVVAPGALIRGSGFRLGLILPPLVLWVLCGVLILFFAFHVESFG